MPPERHQHSNNAMEVSCMKQYSVCAPCRIKKVRCGRERPQCANCIRAGQECSWSEQGKKRNQTVMLSNDLESLGARVCELEQKLAQMQGFMKQMSNQTCLTPTPSPSTFQCFDGTPDDAYQPPTPPLPNTRTRRRLNSRIEIDAIHKVERYFGPTSMEALVMEAQDLFAPHWELLEPHQNKLLEEKLKTLALVKEAFLPQSDGHAPGSPPVEILEAMREAYLDSYRKHAAIWTPNDIQNIVVALDANRLAMHTRAYEVCANNLILLTMDAKALSCIPETKFQDDTIRSMHTMNFDFMKPYLANAKRAIHHVNDLLSPRLINVQALASLAVIAQRHFSPTMFRHLVSLAIHVASSIGFHQKGIARADSGEKKDENAESLLQCLSKLEKAASWLTGIPPIMEINDPSRSIFPTNTNIAKIQEKIYDIFYTEHATPQTDEDVRKLEIELHQDLQTWATESGIAQTPTDAATIESISFYAARILLNWPYSNEDTTSSTIPDVRKYFQAILHHWTRNKTPSHRVQLVQLLASHPCIPALALTQHILSAKHQNAQPDIDLLQQFSTLIHSIASLSDETSYFVRLSQFMSVLVGYADASASASASAQGRSAGVQIEVKQQHRDSVFSTQNLEWCGTVGAGVDIGVGMEQAVDIDMWMQRQEWDGLSAGAFGCEWSEGFGDEGV